MLIIYHPLEPESILLFDTTIEFRRLISIMQTNMVKASWMRSNRRFLGSKIEAVKEFGICVLTYGITSNESVQFQAVAANMKSEEDTILPSPRVINAPNNSLMRQFARSVGVIFLNSSFITGSSVEEDEEHVCPTGRNQPAARPIRVLYGCRPLD